MTEHDAFVINLRIPVLNEVPGMDTVDTWYTFIETGCK